MDNGPHGDSWAIHQEMCQKINEIRKLISPRNICQVFLCFLNNISFSFCKIQNFAKETTLLKINKLPQLRHSTLNEKWMNWKSEKVQLKKKRSVRLSAIAMIPVEEYSPKLKMRKTKAKFTSREQSFILEEYSTCWKRIAKDLGLEAILFYNVFFF